VPNVRVCRVSFTDTEGITHAAQVSASSLYEAAGLALAEFRRCGLMDVTPGDAAYGSGGRAYHAPRTPHAQAHGMAGNRRQKSE
jgi:hypothetical protein